jgi:UDP-3-O-[3-hydroxymyristoyl] glucosamine N-acyltransferase
VDVFAESWRPAAGVHRLAFVDEGAEVAPDASVGPFASVGVGAVIGARTIIHPHATIGRRARIGVDCVIHAGVSVRERVQVGNRVVLQDGVVVGGDGFGFARRPDGTHHKIPQIGGVVVEDDVEIGAGTTIDRGSIDDTVIGAGTKIDNLVHVAHNTRIGRLCLIAAQTGISGSVRIEDGVVIGGQAGFQGHHTIGKGARIGAQSGVFGDVPPGQTWSGYPARPHRESLRAQATLFRLSAMMKRLEKLLGGERSDSEGHSS